MKNYNIKPTPVVMEYKTLEEGERLYDKQVYYGTTKIVQAEYVRSDIFPGNPLIESLPEPRTPRQIFLSCQKEMRSFNYDEMIRKPLSKQIGHLVSLRDLHYVLP